MALITLVDLVARSNSDAEVGIIDEIGLYSPEVATFAARTVRGTSYNVTRKTAIPRGGFRDLNSGVVTEKTTWVREPKSLHIFDLQMAMDEAAASGDDGSLGDLLAQQASDAAQGMALTLGEQVWYGTSADAKGFIGLGAQLATNGSVSASTEANTTSAYLVYMGIQGVHFVVGNDGLMPFSGWNKFPFTADGTTRMQWHANMSGYIGLNVGSEQSVYRVEGITANNNARYLTDARGAELLAKVPSSRSQGLRNGGSQGLVWFMNKQAAYTLQLSRSAIGNVAANKGGGGAFAPMPEELQGIPIVITDMLGNAETNGALV
jgi:hypothetical protein